MKIKTINKVLCAKFDDWMQSLPEDLRKAINDKVIITGGCITSMLLKEKINDFDIYFRDEDSARAVAEHYSNILEDITVVYPGYEIDPENKNKDNGLKGEPGRIRLFISSRGITGAIEDNDKKDIDEALGITEENREEENKEPYRPVYSSENAITLSDKVQLIFRFFGEPDQIHENYDFVHCKNYWTSHDRKLVTNKSALEATLARELVYTGSKYPLCSVFRTRKFINRGWTINAGQYLKMCFQISELDLMDINVLKDQLIGVDSAYFNHMIESLKNNDMKRIEKGYLFEVIDRIFGKGFTG